MNYSQEHPMLPQTEEAGSSPAHQPVTIPYFLYEAMARAYYSQGRNADIPVESPPTSGGNRLNFENVQFNPLDIPPHWKPGGTAAKDLRNVSATIQAPQEED